MPEGIEEEEGSQGASLQLIANAILNQVGTLDGPRITTFDNYADSLAFPAPAPPTSATPRIRQRTEVADATALQMNQIGMVSPFDYLFDEYEERRSRGETGIYRPKGGTQVLELPWRVVRQLAVELKYPGGLPIDPQAHREQSEGSPVMVYAGGQSNPTFLQYTQKTGKEVQPAAIFNNRYVITTNNFYPRYAVSSVPTDEQIQTVGEHLGAALGIPLSGDSAIDFAKNFDKRSRAMVVLHELRHHYQQMHPNAQYDPVARQRKETDSNIMMYNFSRNSGIDSYGNKRILTPEEVAMISRYTVCGRAFSEGVMLGKRDEYMNNYIESYMNPALAGSERKQIKQRVFLPGDEKILNNLQPMGYVSQLVARIRGGRLAAEVFEKPDNAAGIPIKIPGMDPNQTFMALMHIPIIPSREYFDINNSGTFKNANYITRGNCGLALWWTPSNTLKWILLPRATSDGNNRNDADAFRWALRSNF